MSLLDGILSCQRLALKICPPRESNRLPAVGGLSGPAFFPEGLGLTKRALRGDVQPTVMAIGHNFGCWEYRQQIDTAGREDDKATWRNLDRLLTEAGVSPDLCFRTNWFVGLLPGDQQTGKFLTKQNPIYESACRSLLLEEIVLIRPKTILLLGPEVARRAHQVIPILLPWARSQNWADIDRSVIGHSIKEVDISAAGLRASVAAILHPSFGMANQGRRMMNMPKPLTEVEIVRAAIAT